MGQPSEQGEDPMKRLLGALLGAATLTFGLAGGAPSATAQEGCTIALIPG